jgi:hypothetical protein
VRESLARSGTLNPSALKGLAKGTGTSVVRVSAAIQKLGHIDFEEGARGSPNWSLTHLAQKSRQGEKAVPEVASVLEEATGAGSGEESGQPRRHPVEAEIGTVGTA